VFFFPSPLSVSTLTLLKLLAQDEVLDFTCIDKSIYFPQKKPKQSRMIRTSKLRLYHNLCDRSKGYCSVKNLLQQVEKNKERDTEITLSYLIL
jgi:hypothetical protein